MKGIEKESNCIWRDIATNIQDVLLGITQVSLNLVKFLAMSIPIVPHSSIADHFKAVVKSLQSDGKALLLKILLTYAIGEEKSICLPNRSFNATDYI